MTNDTPRKTAEELVRRGLVQWAPARSRGLEINGTQIDAYTKEEQEFLASMERLEGRPLTPQEKHHSVKQARDIGDLPQQDEQSPSETTKEN